MTLFWHMVFATGNSKVDNPPEIGRQIAMFREYGLGSYRDLLIELAKSPAMIFWLDQQMNHSEARNENFGRELLELFSMGIGNYTEEDVKECARAFTGWTKSQTIPRYPTGFYNSEFIYREEEYNQTPDNRGVAELVIGKQRNGPTGNIRMAFIKEYTRFENLEWRRDD